MKFVRVYILDRHFQAREVGRIISDGRRVFTTPVNPRLTMLASMPVVCPVDGELGEVGPDKPDEFLAGLSFQYHGSRLWCGQVEGDATTRESLLEYSPDEERDDHGRWTSGAGSMGSATLPKEDRQKRMGFGTDKSFGTTLPNAAVKDIPPGARLEQTTGEKFIEARDKSSRSHFLSPLVPKDLENHTLLMNREGTVGVAIDKDGDVQNVFNNGGPKGAAAHAMVNALAHGGKTLDCYDGFLPDYYRQFGFVETGRMKFNPEFAHGDWSKASVKNPDVVFMAWRGYDSGGPAEAIQRAGSREGWAKNEQSTKYYEDYDQAKADSRAAAEPRGAGNPRGPGKEQGAQAHAAGGGVRPGAGPRDRGTPGTSSPEQIAARKEILSRPTAHYDTVDPLAKQTNVKYRTPTGDYTPQRQQLHQAIVEHLAEGITPSEHPTMHLLGGGIASGKSTISKALGLRTAPNRMVIDADAIKQLLPEYRDGLSTKDPDAATKVHDESKHVAELAIAHALKNKLDATYDFAGDSGYKALTDLVTNMKQSGHRVEANYVTVDTEKAIVRDHERGQPWGSDPGRFTPEACTRYIHANVSALLPMVTREGLFDHVTLWDTNEEKPRKVMEAHGSNMQVHDPELWKRFTRKASSGLIQNIAYKMAHNLESVMEGSGEELIPVDDINRIMQEVSLDLPPGKPDTPAMKAFRDQVIPEIAAIKARGGQVRVPNP